MKTVYADPRDTSCKANVLETTSYVLPLKTVDAAVFTSSKSLRELPPCDDGSPSILVKAMIF